MDEKKLKVLVCEPLGEEGLMILKNHANFDVDVVFNLKNDELKGCISAYDALLVRSQTQVTSELINLGRNLKLIGRAGVGIDNIDIASAKKSGIAVINTPSGNSISTAEFAFALMMSLARNIPFAHKHVEEGLWQRGKFIGRELCSKTLGIIGFGNVGRELSKRAKAFAMNVIAFDPMVDDDIFNSYGVKKTDLERLLMEGDFVSLHCGLNEKTHKIINRENLQIMKEQSMIINTARGELIDNEALLNALDAGSIRAAALDVYASEPPKANDPLLRHPKIITTPHLGASTEEAQKRVATLLAEQTIGFFSGGKNLTRVV